MKSQWFTILFCCICGLATASTLTNGVSPVYEPFENFTFFEVCRIQIENKKGGTIKVSYNKGGSFSPVGTVLKPADAVDDRAYTASKWARISCVSATAVNAIHIKTDYDTSVMCGQVLTLLPKEGYEPGNQVSSNVIYTDIPGGHQIFGEEPSPFVGNPVFLFKEGESSPLPKGYAPTVGDVIEVQVICPKEFPREIVFENRFGGRIYCYDKKGSSKVIGMVLSPVLGVGRFLGTQYTASGRIRANHSGVIDISTSPVGKLGGIQIIPVNHSMSAEMTNARVLTQWMIIGPLNAEDPSLENIAPFFNAYIRPEYNEDDLSQPDWKRRLEQRFLVQVRVENGPWTSMPQVSYRLDKALPSSAGRVLEKISHIRILFPTYYSYQANR